MEASDVKKPAGLGARVEKRRHELGLTQEQLGARIKVTKGQVSRIESGQSTPSLATLRLLSKALRLTSSDLLDA